MRTKGMRHEIQAKEDIDVQRFVILAYKVADGFRHKGVAYDELKSIAHEAVANAYNAYDPAKGHAFIAYVYINTRSLCKGAIRDVHAQKRQSLHYENPYKGELDSIVAEDTLSALDVLVNKERINLVKKYFKKLPGKWQYILSRKYLISGVSNSGRFKEGYKGFYATAPELAKELGISDSRVNEIAKLAIQRLQQYINGDISGVPYEPKKLGHHKYKDGRCSNIKRYKQVWYLKNKGKNNETST